MHQLSSTIFRSLNVPLKIPPERYLGTQKNLPHLFSPPPINLDQSNGPSRKPASNNHETRTTRCPRHRRVCNLIIRRKNRYTKW